MFCQLSEHSCKELQTIVKLFSSQSSQTSPHSDQNRSSNSGSRKEVVQTKYSHEDVKWTPIIAVNFAWSRKRRSSIQASNVGDTRAVCISHDSSTARDNVLASRMTGWDISQAIFSADWRVLYEITMTLWATGIRSRTLIDHLQGGHLCSPVTGCTTHPVVGKVDKARTDRGDDIPKDNLPCAGPESG